MADVTLNNSYLGSQLADVLLADDLEPGSEISYQVAKTIYLYHPLGEKMVDSPVRAAMSQKREVAVPASPGDHVVNAFLAEWKKLKIDQHIKATASVARIYGVGTVVMGCRGKATTEPLDPETLWKAPIFFNVVDPLNTAGSIVLSQDPNSEFYQTPSIITVSGQPYHPSRAVTVMNGQPIFLAYSNSAFGFVGRSVYQRALYPMKTFVQSMITDDLVTTKVGLLIAKMKSAGSIIDRAMQGFAGLKREMLKGAATGNVLSIDVSEEISTLDMTNVDKAGGWARGNALKNIATAADMPAVMLENETLTEGFGEGSEDAKIIARYIDGIREWLDTIYEFFDPIVMRRAWNPEFYKTIQSLFPEEYGRVPYNTAFYQWVNSFSAPWPNLLKEPESEAVKVEETKAKTLVSVATTLQSMGLDPVNKAIVAEWIADNVNQNKLMFEAPLNLDYQAMEDYVPPETQMMLDSAEQGDEEGDDAAPKKPAKPPLRLAAS